MGHVCIEFVLVFPLFFMLVLMGLDLSLLALQQMSLESFAIQASRRLALSSLQSSEEMESRVAEWAARKFKDPVQSRVSLQTLPTTPSNNSFRSRKIVQVIGVHLQEPIRPHFPLLRVFAQLFPAPLIASSKTARLREREKNDPSTFALGHGE